jgi:hypothetical protein
MQARSTPYNIDAEYRQDPAMVDYLRKSALTMHRNNGGEDDFWIEIFLPNGKIVGEIMGRDRYSDGMTKSEVRVMLEERRASLIRRSRGRLQVLKDAVW